MVNLGMFVQRANNVLGLVHESDITASNKSIKRSRTFDDFDQRYPKDFRISKKQIRPHRLGGEGVLIGGAHSNTKCSMTFVNIAVAISALAGGGGSKNGFAPRPKFRTETKNTVVFSTFFEDFWVFERKMVLKWIFGSFW